MKRFARNLSAVVFGMAIAAIVVCSMRFHSIGHAWRTGKARLLRMTEPETQSTSTQRIAVLKQAMRKLDPLHARMDKSQPGDWLESFPEQGQTFEEWLSRDMHIIRPEDRVLCVVALGDLSPNQTALVTRTAECMARYFNMSVRFLEPMATNGIPARARRITSWGAPQYLSGFILEDMLIPARPKDSAMLIAFTATDLWPGAGWNFVFGEAMPVDKVAVWSLSRMGNLDSGEDERRLALLRTIKIATHETGHMFNVYHCTAWECNMNGCNHMGELDRHPLALCPECLPKICLAVDADPLTRFRSLAESCRTNGLIEQSMFYERCVSVLEAGK